MRATPLGMRLFKRPVAAVVASGSTWASGSSSADWVLSNGNNTGTRSSGSGDALLRDASAQTSGCFEVTLVALGTGNVLIGLTDSAASSTADYVHNHGISYASSTGFVAYNNGFQYTGTTPAAGDKIGVCLKAGKVYFALNGTWQNSADPSAGTGGVDVSSTVGSGMNPAASTAGTGAQVTLNTAGPFMFALPSGVTAWG